MNEGFKVPKIYNSLLWFNFNLKWYFIGVLTGIFQIFRVLFGGKKKRKITQLFSLIYIQVIYYKTHIVIHKTY